MYSFNDLHLENSAICYSDRKNNIIFEFENKEGLSYRSIFPDTTTDIELSKFIRDFTITNINYSNHDKPYFLNNDQIETLFHALLLAYPEN